MFCLLSSVFFSLACLQEIDNLSNEWISSGLDAELSVLLDLNEFGELLQSDYGTSVSSHICFIEDDGGEYWRATVVYNDKVILFQENIQPITTFFDFHADGVYFSPNGKYVAMFENTLPELDNDMNGLWLNAESGEIVYFDSRPGNGMPFICILRDDGSITFTRSLWADGFYSVSTLFFFDNDLNQVAQFDVENLRVPGISKSFFISDTIEGLARFDSDGSVSWITASSGNSQNMGISANGNYYIAPYDNTGVILGSTLTGEVLQTYNFNSYYYYTDIRKPVFSSDCNGWIASAIGYREGGSYSDRERVLFSGSIDSGTVSCISFPSTDYEYRILAANENRLLFLRTTATSPNDPEDTRYVLLNAKLDPLYVTKSGTVRYIAMSSDWNRLLYTDGSRIVLVNIGEV